MTVVVGICAAIEKVRWGAWDTEVHLTPRNYARAVQDAGAVALILPPDDHALEDPARLLDHVDALILAGGADVDPASYGARPHEQTKGSWPERDRFELALTHAALERDMPVLGICRGMQMLNVACGGTIDQHLPDSLGHEDHRHTPGTFGDHDVRVEPGSLAEQAAGGTVDPGQVAPPPGRGRAGRGPGGHRMVGARPGDRGHRAARPPVRAGRALAPRGGPARQRGQVAGRGRRAGEGGRHVISVVEPATAAVMAEVPRAGADDVDAAVERAKAAFPAWRAVEPAERSAVLRRLADAVEERLEDLAVLEARNAGKPIGDARGEMGMVVETFRYYAGAPERLLGDTIPVAGGIDMTFREPLGVVGLIVPWNFPLVIAAWKLGPALAAGNTVVLKPAELTPLTALELEKIAATVLPEGVLNVVAGPGSVCGSRLVEHPDVAKVAFTGSTEVGRGIARQAADTIKRVTLELGGKSANIVFADADLEAAAAAAPMSVFGNAGQDCCARSRILVQRERHGPLHRAAGRRGARGARRRPAGRVHPDGAADLGRPPRGGGVVRARGRAGGHPRQRARGRRASGTRRPCWPRSTSTTAPRSRRSSGRWCA